MKNKFVFFAVCCVLPLMEGFAIITTNHISAEQAPVGFDWNYVVNFNGSSSVVIDPYWLLTAAHDNYTFGASGKGTERWGSNKIDGQLSYIRATGKNNSGSQMYIDTADSVLDSGTGTGGSGGGVFENDRETWKLVEIMTGVITGSSQDAAYAIDEQDYSSRITQTVPEQATGALFVGIGIVVGAVNRIRNVR
ncbi:MAG: hypothetical protein WCG03_03855 [Kiritimatiellales bacterium]